MIINRDISPIYCQYYIGAIVINEIKSFRCDSIDFMDLYMKTKLKQDISISSFSFALEWLFLIGGIKIKHGKIIKCF